MTHPVWPNFYWQCPNCHSNQNRLSEDQMLCLECSAAYPIVFHSGKKFIDFVLSPTDSNQEANIQKYSGDRSGVIDKKVRAHISKQLKIEYILKQLGKFNFKDKIILDIGGGEGTIPNYWYQKQSFTMIGLDLVRSNIEARCHDTGLHYNVVGNMLSLPFQNQSFDACIFFASLHHVPNPKKALEESFRVLKTGGNIMLFEPFSLKQLFNRKQLMPANQVEFSFRVDYIIQLLKETGFAKIKFQSYGIVSKINLPSFFPIQLHQALFNLSILLGRIPILKYLCSGGFVQAVKHEVLI